MMPFPASPAAGLRRFLAGWLLWLASSAGWAQPGADLLPVGEAFRAAHAVEADGRLRLSWEIAADYYLYRDRIRVRALDPGQAAGDLQLPAGAHKADEFFGDVQVYRSRAEAWLSPPPGVAGARRLAISIQGCHEVEPLVCYPPHVQTVVWEGSSLTPDGGVDGAEAGGAADAGKASAAPRQASAAAALPAGGIVGVLLLALAGGVVLNLMPCVLPVLSLKVLSLAQSGEGAAAARRHALWYTAGVLASFVALGLLALAARAAGQGLGWGFQLQHPLAVGVLAYVMFALALALSGVAVLAGGLSGVGASLAARGGAAGDFFTGVLAVVVASPCTAPFMGVALAVALAASGWLALGVFVALGIGLALPFLLVGCVPALAARLPRPGAWMETLKQLLAFPLYASAAWLAWVLTRQRGADALAWLLLGLLLLAFGLWLGERLRYARRPWLRAAALASVLAAAWPLWQIHRIEAPAAVPAALAFAAADGSVPYAPDTLARLRADGRRVFVNMTADWCVTCKANERRLFDTAGFRDTLARTGAVYVKGDWTRTDPRITAFLDAHGAVGVPLYVVFDGTTGEGRVLSTVPSRDQVEQALRGERS